MKTFLEATKLTSVTLSFVNFTVAVSYTCVYSFVLNSSFEEPFAPFTGYNAVVKARGLVLAYHADHGLVILLYHPVSRLVVVTVKVRFTGLSVSRKLRA